MTITIWHRWAEACYHRGHARRWTRAAADYNGKCVADAKCKANDEDEDEDEEE